MKPKSNSIYLDEDVDETRDLPQEISRADVERALKASRGAKDPQVALEYAQRAADVLPDDPQVQASVQRGIFRKLNHDAFIAFLAETEKHYVITFRNSRPVVVPKARAEPEIFPPPRKTEGERVLGMLWWVILGLLPAGIGALILSPLTMGSAIDVLLKRGLDVREKRLALVTVFLAGFLGLLGMFFALLLILHLIG
jgi:hypothetical protein